jgi:RNA recognition motif-containing protein
MSAFDETTVGAVENTGQDAQAAASDAVEATIEAMKNTSISSKNDAQQQETSEVDAAHAVSAAEGRRLYIGNLAYSTTDEQLKAFFAGFSMYVLLPIKGIYYIS